MTHHLEALEAVVVVAQVDAALARGDAHLFLDRVHTVEVGQEQTASAPAAHDDTIACGVELVGRCDRLGLAEHVNVVDQIVQLVLPHRGKARVVRAG